MTKKTENSRNTTFEWLLSILKNSKESALVRVVLWRDRRPFAIKLKQLEKPVGVEAYDKSEYDSICERIALNDQFEIHTELLGRLITKVEGNPYPGEQKRVLKLAVDLIPEGGKGGWCAIFRDPDFAFPTNFENERITFPAEVSVNVRDLERKLWSLVREDDTILAAEVPQVLGFEPNSKAFRVVKSKLEERSWTWVTRRVDGVRVRLVLPPPGDRPL